MEPLTVILVFIGIPVTLAAVIALFLALPGWRGKTHDRVGGDTATDTTIISGAALPDPTRVPLGISAEETLLRRGGASGEWRGSDDVAGITEGLRENLQEVMDRAREICGLEFAIHIGALAAGRESAEAIHGRLRDPRSAVLLAVDPAAKSAEVVTGPDARIHVDDRTCQFALLALRSGADVDDLPVGIRDAVLLLAEHARAPRVLHLDEPV
ncbi:MAG: DUF5130 family protein [Actinobacteria bacterium]|nr:DUF5130 family protein [Actinomycetota bacterium]